MGMKTDKFAFSSSIAADGWHKQKDARSYEWWYFDALSDDGNEALVVVFSDNFIYSPRYNRKDHSQEKAAPGRHPAVSFTYYSHGRRVYRAESEFAPGDFGASESVPECHIGGSSFHYESAPYGSGFVVNIDLPLSRGRRIRAELEWVAIEADFASAPFCYDESAHCWNMVAPRCDVSGRISVTDREGAETDSRNIRGTGYHDHNLDNRWLVNTVDEWHWGRAHFVDSTAVFCRFSEIGEREPENRLLLIKDGELREFKAGADVQDHARDRFGIKYPTRIHLSSDELMLDATPLKVIDSSFYHIRFLSAMTLTGCGDRAHETTGITEFISPRALKFRWLNWLSDLRTGHNGGAARF